VRFDGREFRTAAGINCLALVEDISGTLWALGRDGLLKWDGATLKRYRAYETASNSIPTENGCLWPSRQGGVWIGWGRALWRAQGNRLWRVMMMPLGSPIGSVLETDEGLYLAAGDSLRRYESTGSSASWKETIIGGASRDPCLALSAEGAIWWGGVSSCLSCFKDGRIKQCLGEQDDFRSLACDFENRVWAGTDHGLWVVEDGGLTRPAGLPKEAFGEISALLFDREGNLFVGTGHEGL
jgi:ligand-binding sensor domain-containing protein